MTRNTNVRTEPWPGREVTCTENLVKFGVWFLLYASGQTDRQTDKHANHNTSQPDRGRSNYNLLSMQTLLYLPVKKVKASHTRYRALGLELMTVYRQSARS